MATECLQRSSKVSRQLWWAELPPAEKQKYLSKKQDQKAAFNRKRSIAIMASHKGEYSCKDCIHGLTKSCTDNLEDGCEQWTNPSSDRMGLLELNPKLYKRPNQSKFNKMDKKIKTASFKAFRTKTRVNPNPPALVYRIPAYTH